MATSIMHVKILGNDATVANSQPYRRNRKRFVIKTIYPYFLLLSHTKTNTLKAIEQI